MAGRRIAALGVGIRHSAFGIRHSAFGGRGRKRKAGTFGVVADVRRLFFVSSDNHGRHAALVAASRVIRNQGGCLSLWTPHQVRGDANGERGRKLRGVVRLSQNCGGFFCARSFSSSRKTFFSTLAAKESLCGIQTALTMRPGSANGGAVWVPDHHDAQKRIACPERRRGELLQ